MPRSKDRIAASSMSSTTSCSIDAQNGTTIIGSTVGTTGATGTACSSSSGAYVGTTAGDTGGSGAAATVSGVTYNAAAPSDLVSIGGSTLPNGATPIATAAAGLPVPTTGSTGNNLCNGTISNTGGPIGLLANCSYSSGTTGIAPSFMSVGTSVNPSTLAATGTTLITDGIGFTGSGYGGIAFGGSEDYVENGLNVQFSSQTAALTTQAGGTYAFNGGFAPQNTNANNAISLAQGTYYFSNPNGYAVDLQSSLGFSIAAGSTAYFNGQFYVVNFNNAGSVTFNAGTYVFDGAASLPGTSVTFSGGTYFFANGLGVTNDTSVTFGPGIYYILGGTLNLASANVIANGATFVLEGSANYQIADQQATFDLTAPNATNDPDCVAPSNFPNVNYTGTNFPYDGTDGNGICGVLFYQPASDTTGDGILDNSSSASTFAYLNGIIYQPGAALTMGTNANGNGNGTVEASSGGSLQIEAASVSDPNTNLILSSPGGASTSSAPLALLVQ